MTKRRPAAIIIGSVGLCGNHCQLRYKEKDKTIDKNSLNQMKRYAYVHDISKISTSNE